MHKYNQNKCESVILCVEDIKTSLQLSEPCSVVSIHLILFLSVTCNTCIMHKLFRLRTVYTKY
jgi:hypothetical protein